MVEVVQEPKYKISWANPVFVGKYYQSEEWHGDTYFTNK